jgi:hypothetical protein
MAQLRLSWEDATTLPTRTVPRPTKDKVGSLVYLKPVCGRASLLSCPEKLVLILWAYKRAKQNNC